MHHPRPAALALLLALVPLAHRGEDKPLPSSTEAEPEVTLDNLPPVREVVRAALDRLPSTLAGREDWRRRIRRSALLPRLSVGGGLTETGYDRYEWVTIDEVRNESGAETQSIRGSDSSVSTRSDSSLRLSDRVTDTTGSQTDSSTLEHLGDAPSRSYLETDQGTRATASTANASGTETASGNSVTRNSGSTARTASTSGNRTTRIRRSSEDLAMTDGRRWMQEYSVRLYWDLSDLVFKTDELEAGRTERELEDFRIQLTEKIMKHYYDLKTSLILIGEGDVSVKQQIAREMNFQMLDVLTDGFMRGRLKITEPAAAKP